MSTLALFVTGFSTGLVAGGASCAAVQGGLLATAVTRRSVPAQAKEPAMVGAAVGVPSDSEPAEVDRDNRPQTPSRNGMRLFTIQGVVVA